MKLANLSSAARPDVSRTLSGAKGGVRPGRAKVRQLAGTVAGELLANRDVNLRRRACRVMTRAEHRVWFAGLLVAAAVIGESVLGARFRRRTPPG
jgi:hypothetical protein